MNIQSIQFYNQEIQVLNYEGKPYVAMKPICENIGLSWSGQQDRIRRNEALKQGRRMIRVPSEGGYQEVLCLPLGYLNGWLFGIEINRVKPEIRDVLRLYQLECYDVLYNHFLPEVAAIHPNTIDTEQQFEIKNLVNEVSKRSGKSHQLVYTKLYSEFKIPRYQDLKIGDFNKAIGFLSGMIGKAYNENDRRFFIKIEIRDNLFGGGTLETRAIAHDTNAIVTNFAKELGYEIHSMSKVKDAFHDKYKSVK